MPVQMPAEKEKETAKIKGSNAKQDRKRRGKRNKHPIVSRYSKIKGIEMSNKQIIKALVRGDQEKVR